MDCMLSLTGYAASCSVWKPLLGGRSPDIGQQTRLYSRPTGDGDLDDLVDAGLEVHWESNRLVACWPLGGGTVLAWRVHGFSDCSRVEIGN